MTTQNEVKHTPGPWKLLHHTAPQHDGDRAIYGPGNKVIAEMNGGANDDGEVLANAKLIAAAPELLKAGKKLVDLFTARGELVTKAQGFAIGEMKDAIAEAEGRI